MHEFLASRMARFSGVDYYRIDNFSGEIGECLESLLNIGQRCLF